MQESMRESLRAQNSASACAEMQKAIAMGSLKLKSDLKRSSAFVKKLKVLTDANVAACLKDVAELNLTRYLSECVVALVEAIVTLKPSEVGSHVQVISALHQRYGTNDLTDPLIAAYVTAAFNPPNPPADAAAKQKHSKRRLVTLRVLTELYLVQVLVDIQVIFGILQRVVAREDPNAKAAAKKGAPSAKAPPLDVTLLVSFAKYAGAEFLGPGMSVLVSQTMQDQFRSVFDQAFELIGGMYIAQHQTVRKLEKRNLKEEANRGELCEEHAAEFAAATTLCEKLTSSITTLSEALQKPIPALPVDTSDDGALSQLLVWDGNEGRAELHADGPFDDEDTRSFYEDLPDLLELVPAVVLGLSEAEVAELKAKKAAAPVEEADEPPADEPDADAAVEDMVDATEAAGDDAPAPVPTVDENEKPKDAKAVSYHHQMDAYFATLEDMVNRDRCDKAAVAFCYTNSKAARARLVQTLFSVPRTHLELLAYYSRLAATLHGVLKDDIGGSLVKMLVQEFNYFQKKKNQYRLESKVKNIRFLGELTKFKLCPPNTGFRCLQRLFADFQGHNVVLATTFLETCGRYLYCNKYTHARTAMSLDIMMRLKTAKHLDPLAETLVMNAYYMCKPPERVARVKAPKDPVYLFILSRLATLRPDGVGRVVRVCRKLNWDDPVVVQYVVKAVLHVAKSQVLQLSLVCDVVAGLARMHEELGVHLVDTTIEMLRFLLTLNSYKYHQRCLGLIKLLGELYTHGLVNSVVIFETLYWLLQHGHDTTAGPMETPLTDDALRRLELVPDMKYDPRVPSEVDDDRNVFRIRLMCALLETCGQGFDRGVTRKKLDRFLVFFQHYCLAKSEIPLETEFVVLDLLELLHPKEKPMRFATFADADAAVQAIFALELQVAERTQAKNGALASKGAIVSIAEDDDDDENENNENDDDESGDESDGDLDEHGDDVPESGESESGESDESESESEDEQIIVKHQQPVTTPEDDEFDKAFRALMLSSSDARKLAPRGNADKMAIPTVVKTTHHLETPKDDSSVVFRLLKRGNKGKLEAREILVPQETSLAQHSQRQEASGKKEQSELKRLVLLNVERDELLAQDEALASPTHTPNPTQQYHESRRRQQQQRREGDQSYMHANAHGRGATWDSLESFLGSNRNTGPPVQIMRPRGQQGGRGRGR